MVGKKDLINYLGANICFCCGLFFVLNEIYRTSVELASPVRWWIGLDLISCGFQPALRWVLRLFDLTPQIIENSGNLLFWGSKLVYMYRVGSLYSILVFFGIHLFLGKITGALAEFLLVVNGTHLHNYLHAIINCLSGLSIFSCNPSSNWWWIGLEMITTSLGQLVIIFNKQWTSDNVQGVNSICFVMKLMAGLEVFLFITIFHYVSQWVEESLTVLVLAVRAEQISVVEEMPSENASTNIGADIKDCWNCFTTPGVEVTLYKCRGCKVARYCGEQCQAEDWPGHRDSCKRWKKWRRGGLV